ncbi:hypothetical protein P153DRAFT_408019 [Dothidotthia symphoricarpi CBS 119687]|uniref:P-loop containing nucleoside triphosphate hydrolase protein n=1 Tax=Dothidotthia symphoricarpi CBS 119687 TaxID=1392245 RepID=A0A6A6A5Y6_9PLEO|nr:uncharacterized protein P153DRAFT_408019 [Dothidotthia symphoricarpi CBS 119687]KAF2126021.1 hypothetical protein P153DRAFT_408019 [Dothidotthia symphoricarpi CBS 119687]
MEPDPLLTFDDLDKTTIDVLLKKLSDLIINLLTGAPKSDRELQHLLRTASTLSYVLRSPAIKVALLGAQGAGKSLIINALFDLDGLSLTSAEGAACTSSITRYVQAPISNGETRYFGEIKFLTAAKREALLKEHARSYYYYHNADDDSDDEDSFPVKPIRQDEIDRSLKDTAEDIFGTLFGSRDSFLESWSAPAFKSGEFVRICQLKCEEALKKENVDTQNISLKIADDQRDLLKQIRPFLTGIKGQSCLWPLVDNVAIRFHHDLLQAGIELFDLPGWGDINLSRVRHAEEIKDSVDVEIILADTIRIASDDKVINSVRAAMAHHGASKVKVVATKIDSLTPNQLAQCGGGEYDRIREMVQRVEEQETDEDEDDDSNSAVKRETIARYKTYQDRCIKQRKISERAKHITAELASKLQGRSLNDLPEVFHASASDYMESIKKAKIGFMNQPALSPSMTGVPAIRKFLMSLPAEQNLKDYERHINIIVPAFIEKIKRTVSDTDRDGGFRTIADEFDSIRRGFMTRLLAQAKSSFQYQSDLSLGRIEKDIPTFKEQVEEKVTEDWFRHKGAAFTRILKCRGEVLKGASKAKGLDEGCNWNKELAKVLSPGFTKWSKTHSLGMKKMASSLRKALDQLHDKTNVMMNDSSANLVTVDKAKRKWNPLRHQIQAKLMILMDEVDKLEKKTLEWATMEFGRENNLIAQITDDIYVDVFQSEPELKPPPVAGKKKQYKRYVTPKIGFQKKRMEELFLDPKNHLVDRLLKHFQSEFDTIMRSLLEQHFASIEKLLEEFSTSIRSEAPIDYIITRDGESIRADVEAQIPKLLEMAAELRGKLPLRIKKEDNLTKASAESLDIEEGEDEDFAFIFDKMAKRTRTESSTTTEAKRVKHES